MSWIGLLALDKVNLPRGLSMVAALMALRMASFRSEEHTSELQSLMRISYAVFCLKKKKQHKIERYLLITILDYLHGLSKYHNTHLNTKQNAVDPTSN